MFKSNSDKLKIKSYSVSLRPEYILGKGGYGVVHEAKDKHANKVAAKQIDGSAHEKILKQDWTKLLKLDHENIVKIFDVHEKEKKLWMFMEFCALGDLDKYFIKDTITVTKGLGVMVQIAKAITYLHSENVIHRDIKPTNILIASTSPLVVKVADFDVSKFLEPDAETSGMSSNAGTREFKAPEFFLRYDEKKIRYHRNVDTYAFGLTILAMLQSRPGKPLKPQIETPQDVSELHHSPGMVLATRMQPGIKKLHITIVCESEFAGIRDPRQEMRKLVQKMTSAKPGDRLSAAQVVQNLEDIRKEFPSVEEPLNVDTACESSESSEGCISRSFSSSRDPDSSKPEQSSRGASSTKSGEATGTEILYSRQEPPAQVSHSSFTLIGRERFLKILNRIKLNYFWSTPSQPFCLKLCIRSVGYRFQIEVLQVLRTLNSNCQTQYKIIPIKLH